MEIINEDGELVTLQEEDDELVEEMNRIER